MFKSIKEFFFGKPVEAAKVETKVEAVNSTPYKVEPPVVAAPAATPAKKAKAPAKAKAPVKAPVKAAAKKPVSKPKKPRAPKAKTTTSK